MGFKLNQYHVLMNVNQCEIYPLVRGEDIQENKSSKLSLCFSDISCVLYDKEFYLNLLSF